MHSKRLGGTMNYEMLIEQHTDWTSYE